MVRTVRQLLIIVVCIAVGLLALWRLPGSIVHPRQLDYVRAFDDPTTRSIIVTAAFDAGS